MPDHHDAGPHRNEGGRPDDLDDLDARVLEDLDVDEDAEGVRGGLYTDGCNTR